MRVEAFENNRAEKLVKVRAHVEILFKIMHTFPQLSAEPRNALQYVLLVFFRRFMESMKTVYDHSDLRDNLLIARSVLEGIALLKWILRDPTQKEKRARDYMGIQRIELQLRVQRMKDDGFNWSQSQIDGMKAEISKLSNELIPPEELQNFLVFDEPLRHKKFLERLTGGTIKDLILAAGHKDVYDKTYSMLSGYHHWNPYQLCGCLDEKGELASYGTLPSESFDSYLCCFVSMVECAAEVAQEYKLSQYYEIATLEKSFMGLAI
jgi:Family of unknown function (DUF5677)